MPLRKEYVQHIARLARLNLTPAEIDLFTRDLAVILNYMDQLSSVDTTGIKPVQQFVKAENVFRDDEVKPSLPREKALANAPEHDGEHFLVPKVIG